MRIEGAQADDFNMLNHYSNPLAYAIIGGLQSLFNDIGNSPATADQQETLRNVIAPVLEQLLNAD